MTVRSQFTDPELAAIRAATVQAEKTTGGELVCVIVNRCDAYLTPIWQAATLGALLGAVGGALAWTAGLAWLMTPVAWILAPPVLGAGVGLLLPWLPSLHRRLVPTEVLDRRVDRRAALAFQAEAIDDTRDRTGVLLFIALFEHRVRILTDRGVDRLVPAAGWQAIVDRLTADLHRRRPTAPIVTAVEACGELLLEARVDRRVDDENELSDEPRLYDE